MTHPNILEFEQRRARERQGARTDLTSASTGAEVDKGRTSERIAAKAGVGKATVERAIKVRKQGAPEVQKAVESGEVSLNMGAER